STAVHTTSSTSAKTTGTRCGVPSLFVVANRATLAAPNRFRASVSLGLTGGSELADAPVHLHVHHQRLGADDPFPHAYRVVEPGVPVVLALELDHQQLPTDLLSLAVDEDGPAGQVEQDLGAVFSDDDTAGVREHGAVTAARRLVRPLGGAAEPLAGHPTV